MQIKVDSGVQGSSLWLCRVVLERNAYKGDIQVETHASLPEIDFNVVVCFSVFFVGVPFWWVCSASLRSLDFLGRRFVVPFRWFAVGVSLYL